MNIRRFFDYWNLREDPFNAEEARHDAVYQRIMIEAMTHPDFDKIYGSPDHPATAVVFGEKGSGKTAIRLLMEQRFVQYNKDNPNKKIWVIRYDDLNPILDRLSRSKSIRGKDYVSAIQLSDHQDAILSIGITRLIDSFELDTETSTEAKALRKTIRKLPRQKRIDLATLALLYDQPTSGTRGERWAKLVCLLGLGKFLGGKVPLAITVTGLAALVGGLVGTEFLSDAIWPIPTALAGAVATVFGLWQSAGSALNARRLRKRITASIRTVEYDHAALAGEISLIRPGTIDSEPLPTVDDHDSRYDLSQRFIRIINELGYQGIVVLVDRMDEPVAVSGDPTKMRSLVWPMFNNKFLQQENYALKLLLPVELGYLLNRENADFFRTARMDKQNMIERLEWTGATLYDICTRRLQGCQGERGRRIERLGNLFSEEVTHADIIDSLDQMHQPRDAFKFLYDVIQEHCQNTPDDQPIYTIPKLTLEQVRRRQSQRVRDLQSGLAPA